VAPTAAPEAEVAPTAASEKTAVPKEEQAESSDSEFNAWGGWDGKKETALH
jgi:hypothetical protein